MGRPPRTDGLRSDSYAARAARGRPTISISLSEPARAALDELAAHHRWTRGEVVAVLAALEVDRLRERAALARGETCTCEGAPADATGRRGAEGREHAASCALSAPLRPAEGLGP